MHDQQFDPVHQTEWIDPDVDTEWSDLDELPQTYTNPGYPTPVEEHRSYHSAALLLPDARVIVAGGQFDYDWPTDGYQDEEFNRTARIFTPPYLYTSAGALGPRPTITTAPPTTISYNTQFNFTVSSPTEIAQVVLMRPGATTHNYDMDQRRVPLTFRAVTTNPPSNGWQIRATAPTNGNHAPPGYYMLFVLRADDDATRDFDIPSRAAWIKLQ